MDTTPSAAAGRRHARHDSNGGIPPLRPQPSSPTLTNPDMILPDYDDPEPLQGRLQHLSLGWSSIPPDADQMFDFPDVVDSSAAYPLNTPIIYGNGTMLSDIGEVTEVESNVGGPTRQLSGRSNLSRRSHYSDDNMAARISPQAAALNQFIRRPPGMNPRDNRASMDSLTATTPTNPNGVFPDFDDAVSVGDSNFQGDDEESVASSYIEEPALPRDALATKSSDMSLNEDRYSTSSISRRAEAILANAKRRLTTMEGNLTTARTFSYSSVSDGSTPSPIRSAGRKSPAYRTPAHARNVSENSIHMTPRENIVPQRSASALGAAGGYRQPLPMSRSADSVGHMAHGISQHPLDMALEPLGEDDGAQDEDNSDSTQTARYASPTFNGYNEAGMARSASAAQMRGIQDQMNGLKGKIVSLREQAAADSMKRRSLQSLRAPSLFTHAKVDDSDSDSKAMHTPEQGSPALGSPFRPEFASADISPPPAANGDTQRTPPWKKVDRDPVVARHSPMQNLHQAYLKDENTPPKGKADAAREKFDELEQSGYAFDGDDDDGDDDLHTENGDAEDAGARGVDAADTVSESGDSMYHETYQHPLSHEDREDAFDYEHFFLHSAMGHLSRQGYHDGDDTGSDCSEESVETTRAAPTAASGRPRRPSLDTTTSVDTFATAEEGRASRTSALNEVDDGYESPVIGVASLQSSQDKRLTFGQESGSSSEDSRSSQERSGQPRAFSYRPSAMAASAHPKRPGLHRPSVSSFESTGTNRSFPLISKARISGNTTPRDSPENMMRTMRSPQQSRRSSLNEHVLAKMSNSSMAGSANGSLNGSGNGSVNGSATGSVIGPSRGSVIGPLGPAANGSGYESAGSTNTGSVTGPVNGSANGAKYINGGPVDAPVNGPVNDPINGPVNVPVNGPLHGAAKHTMPSLNGDDQVYVESLLASIQKCAIGLRDMTPSGVRMHDTYRRRLEAARQILDGAPDSF